MSINPLKFLVSDTRRFKLGVLVKEQYLIAKGTLGSFLSAKERATPKRFNKAQLYTEKSWSYSSSLTLPPDVLSNTVVKGEYDNLCGNNSLKVDFNYSVANFENASLYSNGVSHVSLFDGSGARVPKFSSTKFGVSVPDRLKLGACKRLTGTSLSLYGNVENTSGNIGHWMVDGISRLFLALKVYSLEDIDHVIVPKFKYGFQRISLIKLGVTDEKIVELDVLQCVECETLIATTKPRGNGSSVVPGWIIDDYRRLFLTKSPRIRAGKRIYISRRDAPKRKFVNEDEIISCLEQFGFQAIEASTYSFEEKIKLFSDAEIIVGLTGAGLTNLIFSHPEASVLELFPDSFVTYFYTSICSHLEIDYHSLIIKSDSLSSGMDKYHGDLNLDIEILTEAMRTLVLKRGESFAGKSDSESKMSHECS